MEREEGDVGKEYHMYFVIEYIGEDNAEGVKKVINAYVGTCNENDPASLEQIKQNFIAALNDFIIAKMVFCNKHQANCDISNIKVYCGKSKRSGDVSRQVVSVEIVIRDKEPLKDKAKALQQHEMMKMDLDATELAADKKIVSKMGIAGMHLEGYQSKLSCKAGEILKIRQGDGDELARSSCGKQTFCKVKAHTFTDEHNFLLEFHISISFHCHYIARYHWVMFS